MLTLRKSVAAIIIVLSTLTGASAADDLACALKESRVSGEFRSYFFQRDFDGGTTDLEDFAIGGRLHFETGSFSGISAGLSFYTSQSLGLNDDDKTDRKNSRAITGLPISSQSPNAFKGINLILKHSQVVFGSVFQV